MAIYRHIVRVTERAMLLSAIMFFVACAGEKSETEQNYVTFDITDSDGWNNVSRGTELTTSNLATSGFGVFAYYTENKSWGTANADSPNFMNNTRVTKSGTSWQYTPIKYWPHNQNDKVSFFAYAPYIANQTINGSTIEFNVEKDVDDQIDLTWSNSNTTNLNKNTSAVNFTFKHALARIGFNIMAKADGKYPLKKGITMRIKKVTIGYGASTQNGNGLYNNGELDLYSTNVAWSNCSGSVAYSIEPNNFIGQNSDGFTLTNENTDKAQMLNRDDAYIMVIPQGTNTYNIYVEYEVLLSSDDGNGGTKVYNQYTNKCVGTVELNLEASQTYIINMTTDLKNATVNYVSITEWKNNDVEPTIGGFVDEIV